MPELVNNTFKPIRGKKIRVTMVDACGNPWDYNANGITSVTTDGFVTLNLSSEIEEGEEIIQRKASGALCINEKLSDSFKRFTLEMEFCGVNTQLLTMMTNAESIMQYDKQGIVVPEGELNQYFALELWTGLSGGASACDDPNATEGSGYMLLPFLQAGTLGDLEITGEDAITFALANSYTVGGNHWGTGPFDVLLDGSGSPAPLEAGLDKWDHLFLIDTGVAPPPEGAFSSTSTNPEPNWTTTTTSTTTAA